LLHNHRIFILGYNPISVEPTKTQEGALNVTKTSKLLKKIAEKFKMSSYLCVYVTFFQFRGVVFAVVTPTV